MPGETDDFFEDLGRRGHEPLLEKAKGRIKFELTDGGKTERWIVAVDNGDIAVSRKNGRTDCTARTTKKLFEELVRGRENAMAAALRGAIQLDGDPELLMFFQRVLPGPEGGPR